MFTAPNLGSVHLQNDWSPKGKVSLMKINNWVEIIGFFSIRGKLFYPLGIKQYLLSCSYFVSFLLGGKPFFRPG